MRSRLLVLGGGAFLAGACAFPDLQYREGPDGDAAVADGSSGEGGAVAEGSADSADASTDAGDALAPGEGGGDAPDTGAGEASACDQDKDDYHAVGGTCGGNDCCDIDDQVHPGQSKFFTAAGKCGGFDYDCNGKEDPEFPTTIKCGGTGLTGCTGGYGYLSDPGCGNTAPYYQCVANGALACQPGNPVSQTQACH
jgi:hypothetical protein